MNGVSIKVYKIYSTLMIINLEAYSVLGKEREW
jgi:hypothetical protein